MGAQEEGDTFRQGSVVFDCVDQPHDHVVSVHFLLEILVITRQKARRKPEQLQPDREGAGLGVSMTDKREDQ